MNGELAIWILSFVIAPLSVKAVFDWVTKRRNGNGNSTVQKVIQCPINQQEVIDNLHVISETLMLKDEDGIPIRFLLPKLVSGINQTNESLNEICRYLKKQNSKEDKNNG